MANRRPDARSTIFDGMAQDAQRARALVSSAATPRARYLATLAAGGHGVRLKAFINPANPTLLGEAADAVKRVLDRVDAACVAGKWAGAFSELGYLGACLQDFAGVAGVSFSSTDGARSPAQLLAALQTAIRDEDRDAVTATLQAIRTAVDVPAVPASPTATATRAPTAGTTVFVRGERVDLTASELAACRVMNAKPEAYAKNKLRLGRDPGQPRTTLGAPRGRGVITLAVQVGDMPPSEFRLFRKGENRTSKGPFLFDGKAATEVMAAYRAHGVDIAIDLEHLSLEDPQQSRNFDPDARGWCRLELRNGELWAIGVKWTADGAARLREKRQRYISPAFIVDPESRRISQILNIAITASPATDNIQPLVAAAQ